jgi:predicted HAD superfamily hydrolase
MVIQPNHLFYVVGKNLLKQNFISCNSELFHEIRLRSENSARNENECGECTLLEIYSQMQSFFNWNNRQVQKAVEIEFEVESRTIREIPEVLLLLEKATNIALSVNFVSDSYFSSKQIHTLLKAKGMRCNDAKIYSSCEYRKSKSNCGELFKQILVERQIEPDQVLHIGNDYKNDIRNPSLLKINTLHFTNANPTHWDNLLISKAKGTNQIEFISFLLGSARLTRLNGLNGFKQDEILIATNVIAPLIFSYCKWLMQEARRLSLKKLFFISRDGEILMKICNIIKQKKSHQNHSIELRYLFGSRQAWNFPSNEQELDFRLIETFKN